ncbi:MAG: hypothetical protein JXQ73_14095 [Phycisphaerae bacterium]|nr:hypothetical protein [Phycisphaerae bacterium]
MSVVACLCCSTAVLSAPIDVGTDPQLLLDDYVVDRVQGLTRTVHPPARMEQPILDSEHFGTFQPYLSVLYDAGRKRFRLWYNHGAALGYTESSDGIRWDPPRELNLPCTYSCSLVGDGDGGPDPKRRYKIAYWHRGGGNRPHGMCVAFSPDGLSWTPHENNPLLVTYPPDLTKVKAHEVGDIIDAFHDPFRKRYVVVAKLLSVTTDRFGPDPIPPGSYRRLVGITDSTDFAHWTKPRRIFVPDGKDEGRLEFYGMGGIHRRGSIWIGFVRILRDDLPCDPGGPVQGIGYTVLGTSRDGQTWRRDREPFMDRNHKPGTWDHAMTWVGTVLPVGDELFIYYGGYARGHKVERYKERQIGLARMKRDRYVSLTAGDESGLLVTRPIVFKGGVLTVNADVAKGGSVKVAITDEQGRELTGYAESDCATIAGDHLSAKVAWRGKSAITALAGKPVRLRFGLRSAKLYAFQFVSK